MWACIAIDSSICQIVCESAVKPAAIDLHKPEVGWWVVVIHLGSPPAYRDFRIALVFLFLDRSKCISFMQNAVYYSMLRTPRNQFLIIVKILEFTNCLYCKMGWNRINYKVRDTTPTFTQNAKWDGNSSTDNSLNQNFISLNFFIFRRMP